MNQPMYKNNIFANESWALLGASKGLGFEFAKYCQTQEHSLKQFLASRSINGFDFSKTDLFEYYCQQIAEKLPDRIFYFAAGGTYGPYSQFEWKAHQWTLNVTFNFPAYLLHYFLKNSSKPKQIIFIGSSIAESQPDPFASMYCASKHALKGLVESIINEKPEIKLTLFSPGYMKTNMLPKNSWPIKNNLAEDPCDVAKKLFELIMSENEITLL